MSSVKATSKLFMKSTNNNGPRILLPGMTKHFIAVPVSGFGFLCWYIFLQIVLCFVVELYFALVYIYYNCLNIV